MMRSLLLLLFVFPIVHCSCPDGFELVAAGECRQVQPSLHFSSVRVVREQLKPTTVTVVKHAATDTAISQCKTLQAQAVSIHNNEQQTYWIKQFKNGGKYIALGLTCSANGTPWVWADGSQLDYMPNDIGYDDALELKCVRGCAWTMHKNGYWGFDCSDNTFDNTFDIYCTTELPQPSDTGCDSFEVDNDDGVCYQVATAKNFKDGQAVCKNSGGQVASVHNTKENSFLRRLAVSSGAVNGVYLGATISDKGNEWIDGSVWDYDNFYPGFPKTGFGECVILDTGDTSGQWANVDCDSTIAVACMRQRSSATSTSCSSGDWSEGQTIYSPGYPYDASVPCDFVFTVDAGKRVELEIIVLEANSCCDHLIIHENYFGSNVIANLTGALDNAIYSTTSSNSMRVSWQPKGGVNVRGVMMTFRGV